MFKGLQKLVAPMMLVVLLGCMATFTGCSKKESTLGGAVLSAAAGTGIGLAVGGGAGGAIAGGLIGAGVGGVTGYVVGKDKKKRKNR